MTIDPENINEIVQQFSQQDLRLRYIRQGLRNQKRYVTHVANNLLKISRAVSFTVLAASALTTCLLALINTNTTGTPVSFLGLKVEHWAFAATVIATLASAAMTAFSWRESSISASRTAYLLRVLENEFHFSLLGLLEKANNDGLPPLVPEDKIEQWEKNLSDILGDDWERHLQRLGGGYTK